jgi:hypothetical protein
MVSEAKTAFDRLLALDSEAARDLVDRYWSQRDCFLNNLTKTASRQGIVLPKANSHYTANDLAKLGSFLTALLRSGSDLSIPAPPGWLVDILDPLQNAPSLTGPEQWLAIATSYAFADAVLSSIPHAKLTHGKSNARRYIHQNQPVLKGFWDTPRAMSDCSPLTVGRMEVDLIKRGEESGLRDTYDKLASLTRT